MDKIETLLYKILIATESHDHGTCLPAEYFEKTKDCLNEGDIMCTSIDLFTNKAVCYNCSSCSDNTVVQCYHYGNLNKALHVPDINVNIQPNGSISQLKMEKIKRKEFLLSLSGCDCTWPQYNYTRIFNKSHLQQYSSTSPQLLRCQCGDVNYDQLYCPLDDICYNRNAKCLITATEINCTVVKYSEKANKTNVILNEKCSQWEVVQSNCSININFDDSDMESIRNLEDGEHLKITDVGSISIVCPESKCSRPYNVICNEDFDISSCTNSTTPKTSETSEEEEEKNGIIGNDNINERDKKEGNSYTTWLVVIIIVLLLLLLLYVGYQNHQKVSTSAYMYHTMRITCMVRVGEYYDITVSIEYQTVINIEVLF